MAPTTIALPFDSRTPGSSGNRALRQQGAIYDQERLRATVILLKTRRSKHSRRKPHVFLIALVGTPLLLTIAYGVIFGMDLRQERLNAGLIQEIEWPDATAALRLLQQGAGPNAVKRTGAPPTVQSLLQGLWNRLRGVPAARPAAPSALLLAVKNNETPVVEALLKRGAKGRHARDDEGKTLIGMSAAHENHRIMRDLWQYHAYEPEDLSTLLSLAVVENDRAMILTLLAQGAPIHGASLYAGSPFYDVAARDNLPMMQFLLDHGASVNDGGDCTVCATALSAAVENDDIIMARFLLSRGANINATVRFGSALTRAVEMGRADMVRFLLARGADPNIGNYHEGLPIVAAAQQKTELLKLLLEAGADPNIHDWGGPTLLGMVAGNGDAEAVRAVLAAGAHINEHGAYNGSTALMDAAAAGQLATVRLLLRRGALVNIRGHWEDEATKPGESPDKTALDLAIRKQHWDVTRLLRHFDARRASERH